ncbi:MAG: hypothetical protein AAFQ40_02970 [Cyanobacteria bacterium J06623_5]
MTMQIRTSAVLSITLSAITPFTWSLSAKAADFDFGETALETVNYLSNNLKGRSVGTAKEAETVDYLVQQLQGFDYEPTLQPFDYEFREQPLTSYNIVA